MKTKLMLALLALTISAGPVAAQILPNPNPQVLTPIEERLYRAEKSIRLMIAVLGPYLPADAKAYLEGKAIGYHEALTLLRAELYRDLPVAQPSEAQPSQETT